MYFHQDIKGCLFDLIQKEGLKEGFIKESLPKLKKALKDLQTAYEKNTLPVLRLPYLTDDIMSLKDLALKIQDDFTDTVILGTGGSSLGGQAFYALAPNKGHRLHFIDNIDPQTFDSIFKDLNLKSTFFIVISKSGNTAETLVQFQLALQSVSQVLSVDSIKDHFLVIAEPKPSSITKIADFYQIPLLDHDPHVGGRFSALSLVGLLPAMIAGLDPVLIRQGAARVIDRLLALGDPSTFAPAMGAALSYELQKKGKTISILMPYIDNLYKFSLWYRQLWAESLGKKGHGTTPVNGLGAVDQHSQLQLYLDGPKDKFYTIIVASMENQGDMISDQFSKICPSLACFKGCTMGDLMEAEQRATIDTLIKNKRPTRVIEIPTLSPDFMGMLMMHFILETIFMAHLYDVDPFDQPAVEEGKILAKEYLEKILKARLDR
ncbi:MAG: glucose-6-phosphate isomerase [Alphaproteobacteria bacterium]